MTPKGPRLHLADGGLFAFGGVLGLHGEPLTCVDKSYADTPGNAQIWYETVLAFLSEHVHGQEWQRPELL